MTLQDALLFASGVVLLALLLHGWWQSRRAGPRRATAETGPPSTQPAERIEPDFGEHGMKPLQPRRPARIDALIDTIATLSVEAPVSGAAVVAHLPPTRRAGTKPFHVEGLDAESGDWATPVAGHLYGELQAGVQLASRSGALNEIEYSEFVQQVQAFADAIGAMPDFPDMLEVVARARELDALTGPLDAQLTLRLKATGAAWSVGYIQQCAARHGFVAGAVPGRLVLPAPDDGAPPLLVLSYDAQAALADDPAQAALREATLMLDVPQVEARHEPFPAWHRAATALADEMGAALVDDQGQPVTLHAFAAIGRDLEQLYARLEALDMAAGSPAARRLFS